MLPFFFSFVLLISFFAFLNSNENVSFIKLAKFQTGECENKQRINSLIVKLAVHRCIAPILPLTRQRSDFVGSINTRPGPQYNNNQHIKKPPYPGSGYRQYYILQTAAGVRNVYISHKDHSGNFQTARDIYGRNVHYSMDSSGGCYVNILSSNNTALFQEFLESDIDEDIFKLVENAPFLLTRENIKKRLQRATELIPDSLLTKLVPTVHDDILFKLAQSQHGFNYIKNALFSKRCISRPFADNHLWKLPNEFLLELLIQNPQVLETVLSLLLPRFKEDRVLQFLSLDKSAELIKCVLAKKTKPFNLPVFIYKYLWHLDDMVIARWLQKVPEAHSIPQLQPRILYMKEELHRTEVLKFLANETLGSALTCLQRLPSNIAAKFRQRELLNDPVIRERFLDPRNNLIAEFVKHASSTLFIKAAFMRPALWENSAIENRILILHKSTDPKLTETEKEELFIMANAIILLKELDPGCREAIKNADINFFQLVQAYKNKKQWDIANDTVRNFKGAFNAYTKQFEGVTGSSSALNHDTIAALGNLMRLTLEFDKDQKIELAEKSSDLFKYICELLKGAGEEVIEQLRNLLRINLSDAVIPIIFLLSNTSPLPKVLFLTGMMAYGAYNNLDALKTDINNLYNVYNLCQPAEVGRTSIRVFSGCLYVTLSMTAMKNFFKAQRASGPNLLPEGKKAAKAGARLARKAQKTKNSSPKVLQKIDYCGNAVKRFGEKALDYEHVFSEEHDRNGIMDLGSSKKRIMDMLVEYIIKADKMKLLKDGHNQVRDMVNGHEMEIRFKIINGEILKITAFRGWSPREINNVVNFYLLNK